MNIRYLTICSMFTAIMCVLSPISIPFIFGIPITLQTLTIMITAIVLDTKKAVIVTSMYVLLGAVGLPVFAGATSGVGIVFGTTGGFILSFPILAFIVAYITDKHNSIIWVVIALLIGNFINFSCGAIWFSYITKTDAVNTIKAVVLPFLSILIIQIMLAVTIGMTLKKALQKQLKKS